MMILLVPYCTVRYEAVLKKHKEEHNFNFYASVLFVLLVYYCTPYYVRALLSAVSSSMNQIVLIRTLDASKVSVPNIVDIITITLCVQEYVRTYVLVRTYKNFNQKKGRVVH